MTKLLKNSEFDNKNKNMTTINNNNSSSLNKLLTNTKGNISTPQQTQQQQVGTTSVNDYYTASFVLAPFLKFISSNTGISNLYILFKSAKKILAMNLPIVNPSCNCDECCEKSKKFDKYVNPKHLIVGNITCFFIPLVVSGNDINENLIQTFNV